MSSIESFHQEHSVIDYDGKNATSLLLRMHGSVLPGLAPRIGVGAVIGGLAAWLHAEHGLAVPAIGHTMIAVALGLLLVFRTNASYDRFWEGRKLVGGISNASRDLARQTASWLVVEHGTDDAELRAARADVRRWIVAFYVLLMRQLRDRVDLEELDHLLTRSERAALESPGARSLVVSTWISQRLAGALRHTDAAPALAATREAAMDGNLRTMLLSLGGCERIRGTPVPFAYAQHIKFFVFLFCYTAPFAMVADMGWMTPIAAAVVCFALFGIDEIGVEIENPFGTDPNDLAMDAMARDIEACTAMIDGARCHAPHESASSTATAA